MRVGILVHKCSGGGAERVAGELSRLLDEAGCQVFFCTFFREEDEYSFAGERIHFSEEKRGSLFTVLARLKWVGQTKRDRGLDVMISFLPQANVINLLTGARTIVSFRNDPASLPSVYKILFGLILHRAEKIVAVSRGVEEAVKREYPAVHGKTTTIYSPARFKSIEKRPIRQMRMILSVGRLEEQKAHHRTIAAFAALAKSRPGLILRIFGEGSLKSQLQAQAEATGFGDRIEILPFKKEIQQDYLQADLLVLASNHEGLSNVLVEALAMGLPIVATDCPYGSRELVAPATPIAERATQIEEHEFGVLSPLLANEDQTIEALTKAIKKVLDDQELQAKLTVQGPKRAADFSGEEIAKIWRRLINP